MLLHFLVLAILFNYCLVIVVVMSSLRCALSGPCYFIVSLPSWYFFVNALMFMNQIRLIGKDQTKLLLHMPSSTSKDGYELSLSDLSKDR